jgi:hypothetical protein
MNDPLEDSANVFADLVLSFLAILIVVTMLGLLLVTATQTQTQFLVGSVAPKEQAFPVPSVTGLPSSSTFFYVSDGRLSVLDLAQLANSVLEAQGFGRGSAQLLGEGWPAVGYEFLIEETVERGPWNQQILFRDPAGYDITITFPDALTTMVEAQTIGQAFDLIVAESYDLGRFPNFIVSPSGFDLFAGLERLLVERNRCFRWVRAGTDGRRYSQRFIRTGYYFELQSSRRCTA